MNQNVRIFFLNFMKGSPIQLTAGDYAIKLSVLKNYDLEMTYKQTRFELALLISHAFLFQVFNAIHNLKATSATRWSLGLSENFTDLKSDDKGLFWHVFEKIFCHQFYF